MSKMIDIEYIKKWVNITEEELMQRLVKDAVSLMKEAKRNEKIAQVEARREDPEYDISFVKDFFKGYTYFSKWFSDEEILRACQYYMSKRDLASEEAFRGYREEPFPGMHMRFLRHALVDFTECRGSWERKVRDDASIFLVPNRYQNVSGASDVAEDLLQRKCMWTKQYHIDIYELTDCGNDWIFFKNPKGKGSDACLYVPFSALMDHDADKILETHKNYWEGYNHTDTTEFLNSPFVQEIIEHVRDDARAAAKKH